MATKTPVVSYQDIQRLNSARVQAQRDYAKARDTKQSAARQKAALDRWNQQLKVFQTYNNVWVAAGRPGAPLDPTTDGAQAVLQKTLDDWGLGGLAPVAMKLLKQGLDENAIVVQLQQSAEYKKRFAANDARAKNGLAVLSPAEYLDMERSYQATLRAYGLPSGFYDSPDDFTRLIGRDVSAQEFQQRVQDAQGSVLSQDENTRRAWTQLYGLSTGDAVAMFLDPDRAAPLVHQKAQAAQIAGEALRFGGLQPLNTATAEGLAAAGVTGDQARQGFGDIAGRAFADMTMASRFQTAWGQQDEINDALLGDSAATEKRRSIYSQESALFQGSSGLAGTALSQRKDS